MRVITGLARGRRLISPEGNDVRPTTDKVKESIFNIIQFDIENAVVLDLFSGSGQLGIEAISRGAKKTVFVDSSKKSINVVKSNIALCGFEESSHIIFTDAFTFLNSTNYKFDIVFLDPPYNKGLCKKALLNLSDILNDNAYVICETQINEDLSGHYNNLKLIKEYKYSTIKLSVFLYQKSLEE